MGCASPMTPPWRPYRSPHRQGHQELVGALNEYGHNAVGISGADGKTFKSEQVDPELGRVGSISEVDTSLIETIIEDDYIPVIASVGCGPDWLLQHQRRHRGRQGRRGDRCRQAHLPHRRRLASSATRTIPDTLIAQLTKSETQELLESQALDGGMIPKIQSIYDALDAGVGQVIIINGKFPHSLLLEIFTDEGIGTMFLQD